MGNLDPTRPGQINLSSSGNWQYVGKVIWFQGIANTSFIEMVSFQFDSALNRFRTYCTI